MKMTDDNALGGGRLTRARLESARDWLLAAHPDAGRVVAYLLDDRTPETPPPEVCLILDAAFGRVHRDVLIGLLPVDPGVAPHGRKPDGTPRAPWGWKVAGSRLVPCGRPGRRWKVGQVPRPDAPPHPQGGARATPHRSGVAAASAPLRKEAERP